MKSASACLAPAQSGLDEVIDKGMLLENLNRHFLRDSTPVMVAIMKKNGDLMQEFCRGMVVPNDWPEKALQLKLQGLPKEFKLFFPQF